MKNLRNITIADLRKILSIYGCTYVRTKGGHEAWKKPGVKRPLIFQNHVTPVPEPVVKNLIRDLQTTREEFLSVYESL